MNIAVNGAICASERAVISAYDHGFLYGIGLFETFRTYGGVPFLLDRHLRRLAAGCRELAIPYIPDEEKIGQLTMRLLQANGLTDGYFRLTVTAGQHELGLPEASYADCNEILYVKALPETLATLPSHGKPLQLLSLRRTPAENGGVRLKSLHYMNSMLARRELGRYPWAQGAEGVMLDQHGKISEGIVSNLFFIHGDVCHTPALETGALPGITRETVIELAKTTGLQVEEGLYEWRDFVAAEEIFITNSIQEIVFAPRLFDLAGNSATVGDGRPGRRTAQLQKMYRQLIDDERTRKWR